MSKWHKGPPPSVGWWPASAYKDPSIYRWWDGEKWSEPAINGMSSDKAEVSAKIPAVRGIERFIRWQHRPKSWPERSHT